MKKSLALLAGFTALGPLVAAQLAAPLRAEAPARFSPPQDPMVLSRTVIRVLPDGKQIVVKRSFRVQFVASGADFLLKGEPLEVTVDVPPVLARLGELERQRTDLGPFPIHVGSDGLMHPGTAGTDSPRAYDAAKQTASGMIQATNLPGETKRDAIQVLGVMASDPRSSPWPADLFSATDPERHQHRSVTLADGSQGEVDVVLRVDKWLPCGMPASFERIITTELAGTRRVSREVWNIGPSPNG